MSSSESRTAFFSTLETLLEALEGQRLPLEAQRSLGERALRVLGTLTRQAPAEAERQPIARVLFRLAAASEQWTFTSLEAAECFAWAAAVYLEPAPVEAELLLRRALAIWERLYSPVDERVLTARHNLAALLENLGRYGEAEELLRQVIASRTRSLDANQQEVAVSLHNLARVYALQEKFAEAEALARKALALAEQAWGVDHPFTITVLYHLALVSIQELSAREDWQEENTVRLAEVEALVQRVYASWRSSAQEDLTATRILHQLALLLLGQEKWSEAEAVYQRVLASYARLLGADDLTAVSGLDQMVLCYQRQEKIDEALATAWRSLELRERVLGASHPDLVPALCTLATLSLSQDHFTEAEELVTRAQFLCDKQAEPAPPALILLVNTRLLLYTRTGRAAEAMSLLDQLASLFANASDD